MQCLRRGHQHFHAITAAVISLGHPLLTSLRLSSLPVSALRSLLLLSFRLPPCQCCFEAAQELVREECGGTAAWHRRSTHTDTTEFKEQEGERARRRCRGGTYVSMRCWDFVTNKAVKSIKEKNTLAVGSVIVCRKLYTNVTTMVQIRQGSGWFWRIKGHTVTHSITELWRLFIVVSAFTVSMQVCERVCLCGCFLSIQWLEARWRTKLSNNFLWD